MKHSLSLVLLVLSTFTLFAQTKEYKDVNFDNFMIDTQFTKDSPDEIVMIWWLPIEFWAISYEQDPSSTPGEIEILKEMFEGYEIFAITKGKIGYFGGITYEPIETLRDKFSVTYNNQSLKMVNKKNINADLSNFISMMSPMLSNLLGQMGENMHFVVMEDNKKKEVLPISTTENIDLTLTLDDFIEEVDLPLNSMLVEKKCPNDDELLSGKWNFCPIHGTSLKGQ